MNISYFINSILSIGMHVRFSCTIMDMYSFTESRNGFISIIKLKCSIFVYSIYLISQIETDYTSEKNSNVNICMVSETIFTSGEH